MYSEGSNEKKLWNEAESLRRIAFFGICIRSVSLLPSSLFYQYSSIPSNPPYSSTVATLTAIVAIPALYNYMQHVQSSLQTEVALPLPPP